MVREQVCRRGAEALSSLRNFQMWQLHSPPRTIHTTGNGKRFATALSNPESAGPFSIKERDHAKNSALARAVHRIVLPSLASRQRSQPLLIRLQIR